MVAPCCKFVSIDVDAAMAKRKKGQCCERGCSRPRRADRLRCTSCAQRRSRATNPLLYAFDNLRTHARSRGKAFTLTIKEFREFCSRTRYHELKGKAADSLTVDRIDPGRGYEVDNIRVLTHALNSARRDTFTEEEIQSATARGWMPANTPVEF